MALLPDHMPIVDERVGRGEHSSPYPERELTTAVDLCDERGRLSPTAVGWSRVPLVRANLSGHPFRKKRWNFWNWISPEFVFSVTVANLDYAAFCSATFTDLESGESDSCMVPAWPRSVEMPEQVERPIRFDSRSIRYENCAAGDDLRVHFRGRGKRGSIEADFGVRRPSDHESLNVVVPWSEHRFQLNSKHNTLPCEGRVTALGRHFEMDPRRCHAVQDWGRGVWPRRSFWNWAVATGEQDGRLVGVNMGAKWTTGTGSNENGVILDGRLHKIMEDLNWSYDPVEWRKPWRVRSVHSNALDLVLEPSVAHQPRLELGLLATGGVCAFGRWSGNVHVAGESIEIREMVGWAEEFAHRW